MMNPMIATRVSSQQQQRNGYLSGPFPGFAEQTQEYPHKHRSGDDHDQDAEDTSPAMISLIVYSLTVVVVVSMLISARWPDAATRSGLHGRCSLDRPAAPGLPLAFCPWWRGTAFQR